MPKHVLPPCENTTVLTVSVYHRVFSQCKLRRYVCTTCLFFGTFISYRSRRCLSKLTLSHSVSKPPMQKQNEQQTRTISSTAGKRRASEFCFMVIWLLLSASECWHFQLGVDAHNTCVSQTCHGHIQDLDANLSPAAERQSFKCSGARLVCADDKSNEMSSMEAELLDSAAGSTGASETGTKEDRPQCWRKHDVIGQDIQYIIELSSLSFFFGGEGLTFCNDLQRTPIRSCRAAIVTNMSTAREEVFIVLRLSFIKGRDYSSTFYNGEKSHKLPRQVV